jgi:hypothetical protein
LHGFSEIRRRRIASLEDRVQRAQDVADRLRLATEAAQPRQQPRDVRLDDPIERLLREVRHEMGPEMRLLRFDVRT